MPSMTVSFKIHEKQLGYPEYRGEFIVGEVGEDNKVDKAFISTLFKEFIRELNFYIRQKNEAKKKAKQNVPT